MKSIQTKRLDPVNLKLTLYTSVKRLVSVCVAAKSLTLIEFFVQQQGTSFFA